MEAEVPAHEATDDWTRIAWFFGLAVLIPGVAILLHELGHFVVHEAFGYELNRLTFSGVISRGSPSDVDPEVAQGLSFAAAHAVSLALAGAGVLSVWMLGANPTGLALVMFECVRILVGLGVAIHRWGLSALHEGFGELRYLGRALDVPAVEPVISWFTLLLPAVALVYVVRRLAPGRRLRSSAAALLGLGAGLALWMLLLGPLLLPR